VGGGGDRKAGTAIVVAGLLLVPIRRPGIVRVTALVIVAFGCGVIAQGGASAPSELSRLASRVPICDVAGEVLEHAGGLGTFAKVYADCGDAGIGTGVVVVDGYFGVAGATLSARGRMVPLSDTDFERARRRHGAHASFAAVRARLDPPRAPLLALAARLRRGLERASNNMRTERAGLLRGLAIGDTRLLSPETTEELRAAGLTHLVAVSGANVAIVVGSVAIACAGLTLRLRLVACLGALVVYVCVVGPEPSVLRAAAMGTIALWALAFGRRADPLAALGLALIAVIGTRPALVRSVGLHLSAAATGGIVTLSSPISSVLRRFPDTVRIPLAATFAAQLAVAPILISAFGSLSLVAPLANVVALPAIAPATVLGILAAVAGAVWPPLGRVVAAAADPFVAWVLWVGEGLGSLPAATVDLPRPVAIVMCVPLIPVVAWAATRPRR
jgi:competence protein ComEC